MIGIHRNTIRVVLNTHKWTRINEQWNDNQACYFDVPLAYKCEFEILAKAYGTPERQRHTGNLIYKNCG